MNAQVEALRQEALATAREEVQADTTRMREDAVIAAITRTKEEAASERELALSQARKEAANLLNTALDRAKQDAEAAQESAVRQEARPTPREGSGGCSAGGVSRRVVRRARRGQGRRLSTPITC